MSARGKKIVLLSSVLFLAASLFGGIFLVYRNLGTISVATLDFLVKRGVPPKYLSLVGLTVNKVKPDAVSSKVPEFTVYAKLSDGSYRYTAFGEIAEVDTLTTDKAIIIRFTDMGGKTIDTFLFKGYSSLFKSQADAEAVKVAQESWGDVLTTGDFINVNWVSDMPPEKALVGNQFPSEDLMRTPAASIVISVI